MKTINLTGTLTPLTCMLAWVCFISGNTLRAQPAIDNVDLSGDVPAMAAAVPVAAVDPRRPGHVAVIWRFIDPLGGSNARTAGNWVCHLSISADNGRTFSDQTLHWGTEPLRRCNAPWVGFSQQGEIYIAATLTGDPPAPAGPPNGAADPLPPAHPQGTVGIASSSDGGRTWRTTVKAIPSNAMERFETDPSIPDDAKQVPWDGARAAVGGATGAIFVTGAFPARPGGSVHSQRFYSASADAGRTFGPIRAFGNAEWPERWDGDIAAAGGEFIASYIADSTPIDGARCPCAVVAISRDAGRTMRRQLVADASQIDLDTLVHYPEVAADPAHRGRLALTAISATKTDVLVYISTDDGRTWNRLSPAQPPDVASVSRPALSFSPRGVLVAAWRGVHADGTYDIYAAATSDGRKIGATLRISSSTSHTPEAWLNTYAVRGDFHTTVAAGRTDAHVSWADARTGTDVRVYTARVSLRAFAR